MFWYGTSGFMYFELSIKPDLAWGDAIWWTLVTMTTVGYGDYYPETFGGRYLIAVPSMTIGIGILGFIISELSVNLIASYSRRARGLSKIKFDDHVLIINYQRLDVVQNLVAELKSDTLTCNKEICLIDNELEEIPHTLDRLGVRYIRGNPTDIDVLERANIKDASHAIILSNDRVDIHSDDINLSLILVVKHMNKKIFTIAEVMDAQKIERFEIAGCDSIICSSEFSTNLIIQELQDPGVKEILYKLTSNRVGQQVYLVDIKSESKSYKDLVMWSLEKSYSIIGLLRGKDSIMNVGSNEMIIPNDKAIIIGVERLPFIEL